jgi:hypothetical protein
MRALPKLFAVMAMVLSAMLPTIGSANVVGTANISNCAGGAVEFSAAAVTWFPAISATTGCVSTDIGTALVYSGGTIGAGVSGDIKNLTLPLAPGIDHFIDIPAAPTAIDFLLSGFMTSIATNASCAGLGVGQSCLLSSNLPLLLVQLQAGHVALSLTEFGTVTDGVGNADNWTGTLTSELVNLTPLDIQNAITGSSSLTISWSESITVTPADVTALPEPGSLALAALAIFWLGWVRRRA